METEITNLAGRILRVHHLEFNLIDWQMEDGRLFGDATELIGQRRADGHHLIQSGDVETFEPHSGNFLGEIFFWEEILRARIEAPFR